jgi:hypothetical protein
VLLEASKYPHPNPLPGQRLSINHWPLEVRGMELTKERLIDALSLTRERVRVWVSENST